MRIEDIKIGGRLAFGERKCTVTQLSAPYVYVHFDGDNSEISSALHHVHFKALPVAEYYTLASVYTADHAELNIVHCSMCGACVLDTAIHTAWHEDMEVSK